MIIVGIRLCHHLTQTHVGKHLIITYLTQSQYNVFLIHSHALLQPQLQASLL